MMEDSKTTDDLGSKDVAEIDLDREYFAIYCPLLDGRPQRRDVDFIEKHKIKFTLRNPPPELYQLNSMNPIKECAVILLFLFLIGLPFFLISLPFISYYYPYFGLPLTLIFFALSFVKTSYSPQCQTYGVASWILEYFSTWIVWPEEVNFPDITSRAGVLLYTVPHAVLPLGSLLAHFVLERITGAEAHGYHASILSRVPLLNILIGWIGAIPATKPEIFKVLYPGSGTGGFIDGIAGVFYSNREKEILYVGKRKGAFKIALQTGSSMVAGHAFGATQTMDAWYDSYGCMQKISRKLQMTVMIPYGRFFLPTPRRIPILLFYNDPILVEKIEDPSLEQILDLKKKFLQKVQTNFEIGKKMYKPYEAKELEIM